MATKFMLELFLLVFSVLLKEGVSQCVPDCGCSGGMCCLVISENSPPNTIIGKDDSENITNAVYSIDRPTDLFAVNATTGEIYTLQRIDRETLGDCLTIFIYDGVDLRPVSIKISDVNDNGPEFDRDEYVFNVSETTADRTRLQCDLQMTTSLTAQDRDTMENGVVLYRVINDSRFSLDDPLVPCVRNSDNFVLDYDQPPTTYSFILVAEDRNNTSLRSQARVTYNLIDVNDNKPYFENETYSVSIRENFEVGSEIIRFRAHDNDSGINGGMYLKYSVSSVNNNVFTINMTTGSLILNRSVDAGNQNYNLIIFATDIGQPPLTGSAHVMVNILDINEDATIDLRLIHENIKEGTTANQPLGRFTLRDNDVAPENVGNNSVAIVTGRDNFRVVQLSATTFILILFGTIDREKNKSVTIVIETTEYGDPVIHQNLTLNFTVLDINDNAPDLRVKNFNFTEEATGNQIIVNLGEHAFDPDNGVNGSVGNYELVSVTSQNGTDLTTHFRSGLTPSTGVLTATGISLDRDTLGDFLTFNVNLTDRGTPPQSNVVTFTVTLIDVNDNRPMFNQTNYSFIFLEEQAIGSHVGTVKATDRDAMENGRVTYGILSDNFTINATTGALSSRVVFDREKRKDPYMFTVMAHDNGVEQLEAENVTVLITIGDIDDNDPIFTEEQKNIEINTSLRPGSKAGSVMATDADDSPFNRIIYELESPMNFFSVQRDDGRIILEQSLTDEKEFTFNISAFNEGRRENASYIVVHITVIASPAMLTMPAIIGIAASGAVLLVFIIILVILVLSICYKNRKYRLYEFRDPDTKLNNLQQNSILKLPATNGVTGRGRVRFKPSVMETHYPEQSMINDSENTIIKEADTKFDTNDNSPQVPHNHQPEDIPVLELKMSPGANMNMNGGMAGPPRSYPMRPHSPIITLDSRDEEGFSQGTSSDGHPNSDLDEDEESNFTDDASMINTAISGFGDRHNHNIRYETPSTHSPHLELTHHLPPISHTHRHINSSSLRAHNLAELEASRQQQQYNTIHGPEHDHSLTLTPPSENHHHQHSTLSTHCTHSPPSPTIHHPQVGTMSSSKHLHSGGRNYPHPLVMPDAFPRDTTDIHRFPIGSSYDYGEASTYASTELDEALGFNLEADPMSLIETDYEDAEL